MAVDKVGRLHAATHAGIQMFDPTGRMGGVINKPTVQACSNVVFGGPGHVCLYATCQDKVFRRKTKSPRQPSLLRDKRWVVSSFLESGRFQTPHSAGRPLANSG